MYEITASFWPVLITLFEHMDTQIVGEWLLRWPLARTQVSGLAELGKLIRHLSISIKINKFVCDCKTGDENRFDLIQTEENQVESWINVN